MWMAIIAMAFYALEIAITDAKLGSIPPKLITLYYSAGVAMFALVSLLISKEQVAAPSSSVSFFIFLMILASFIAATAHFEALNQGIGTAKLTLAYAFLPVVGSLYSIVLKKEFPTWNLLLAWCFAATALYLVSMSQKSINLN